MSTDSLTYQAAGVDTEKAGQTLASFAKYLKTRPQDPNVLSGVGPFASCYSLKDFGNEELVLVTSCDGVGTKLKLALDWGNISGLGSDLVAMNVNDCLCAGALPKLFLDYFACAALDQNQLLSLLRSIQEACELAECSLVGGETAEMPGLYQPKDFDLAGFTIGFAQKKNLLGPEKVRVGDRIIALAAKGFHSNGYSLIRKIIDFKKLQPESIPSFDHRKWKEILLEPTPIYVRALKNCLTQLNGLAHITGGGLYENLVRILPEGTLAQIRSADWNIPILYRYFQDAANLDEKQLLSTFNCGVGMLASVSSEKVEGVLKSICQNGVRAWEVGEVLSSKGKPQIQWD